MALQKKWKRTHRDVNLYFEGYEKRELVDPITGKRRTEYQYTGDYYLFRLDQGQFRRYKVVSALLTLGGTAAFLAASLLGPQGSVQPYMALPALLSLIPLCYLLMGLWGLLRRGGPKMTIRDYTFGLGRMKNSLWGVLALWAVTLVAHGFYMVSQRDFSALELGCGGLELLALALLAAQWRIQEETLSACIHKAESQYDKQPETAEEEK